MVTFSGDTKERLYREAVQSYPEECCGVLLGERTSAGTRIVKGIRPQRNVAVDGERGHRFVLSPQALMSTERYAAEMGYDIVGFYHSHPDCSADASVTDARFAIPELSYPILSVVGGRVEEICSYEKRIVEQREYFSEEEVIWSEY